MPRYVRRSHRYRYCQQSDVDAVICKMLQEARHLGVVEALNDDVEHWMSRNEDKSQIEISGLVTVSGHPLVFRYE